MPIPVPLAPEISVTPEQLARLMVVENEVKTLQAAIEELTDTVKKLTAVLNRGEGAWRVMLVLGAVVSFIGGAAMFVWKMIH